MDFLLSSVSLFNALFVLSLIRILRLQDELMVLRRARENHLVTKEWLDQQLSSPALEYVRIELQAPKEPRKPRFALLSEDD